MLGLSILMMNNNDQVKWSPSPPNKIEIQISNPPITSDISSNLLSWLAVIPDGFRHYATPIFRPTVVGPPSDTRAQRPSVIAIPLHI